MLLEQGDANRTVSSENSVWFPWEEENMLCVRFCNAYRNHTNGLRFREAARDKVWERQRPLASLDLLLALAKEEITNKCVVIFSPVLGLATQKVEQGLKEPVSGAVLACFVFSPCLVLTQHGIAWERQRENRVSEEERGPHIMKSSTEISGGGGWGGIFFSLHARFLATFKLILSVHFNTVTEVA